MPWSGVPLTADVSPISFLVEKKLRWLRGVDEPEIFILMNSPMGFDEDSCDIVVTFAGLRQWRVRRSMSTHHHIV